MRVINKITDQLLAECIRLINVYFVFLLVFNLFRISFILRLENGNRISDSKDFLMAFVRGSQFDTVVICYALILPVFFIMIGSLLSEKYNPILRKISFWYSCAIFSLYTLILLIDQFYYIYFQAHINVLIFGLIDDDTVAVIHSVWSDYPIIWIILIWLTLIGLFSILLRKIHNRRTVIFKIQLTHKAILIPILISIFIIGLRGSLGIFPLQIQNSTVSENKFINFLATNGIFTLKNAISERSKGKNLIKAEKDKLKALGYSNVDEAASDYFADFKSKSEISDSIILNRLFDTTSNKPNLSQSPNVVFIMMESMSGYNIDMQSSEMNLLGSLKEHFDSDILFKNFVSSGNITIQSLEYLMVNSSIPLSQTKYRYTPLQSSVALPFKEAGYETSFITGGKASWRNINEFAPYQKFDYIEDGENISADIKNSDFTQWGVYDENLFSYIYKKLSVNKKKPQFLFVQTTSNHTPFDIPKNYIKQPICFPDSIKKKLVINEDLALKNLYAYQYANNCFGNFLTKIKNSNLGKNTIVVMTGDHTNLMLYNFDETQQLQQLSVPFYIYCPEKLLPKHNIDESRFGSHKDIFPTIYNLALSNTRYLGIGNDLLAEDKDHKKYFFGLNSGSLTAFDKNGAINFASSNSNYYKWNNSNKLIVQSNTKSLKKSQLFLKARSSYALSAFFILDCLEDEWQ